MKDDWIDLTAAAREGKLDPLIGREHELDRIVRVLLRRTRNSPLLLGPPGVGKTALVEGLAQRIADGNVPEPLRATRICAFDLGLIVAEARGRSDLRPLESLFVDALGRLPIDGSGRLGTVLFLDELPLLIAGAAEGARGMSSLLRLAMKEHELTLIVEVTPRQFAPTQEMDVLDGLLQPIVIAPPTLDETVVILQGVAPRFARFHGVTYEEPVFQTAVSASQQLTARALPDPAVDLLDEAGARAIAAGRSTVTAQDVAEVARLWSAA